MSAAPVFPPLLSGQDCAGADPVAHACAAAREGCDAGLILYDLAADRFRLAVVLAPEVPLARAMAMLPLAGVALQNALGALAPPEVAVQLDWDGGLRLNGGLCGRLRALAPPGTPPDAEPDWLVIAADLALWPESDETGLTPERTALYAEGCADVAPDQLLEAFARHLMVWLHAWEEGGNPALYPEWKGLVPGPGASLAALGLDGTWLGVDEDFGLVLKTASGPRLVPLTDLLETAP